MIMSAGRSWLLVRDSFQTMTRPFERPEVARVFKAYPAPLRHRLMRLRQLIFDTATALEGVGRLQETLRRPRGRSRIRRA